MGLYQVLAFAWLSMALVPHLIRELSIHYEELELNSQTQLELPNAVIHVIHSGKPETNTM